MKRYSGTEGELEKVHFKVLDGTVVDSFRHSWLETRDKTSLETEGQNGRAKTSVDMS